jgi:hypothetical protein
VSYGRWRRLTTVLYSIGRFVACWPLCFPHIHDRYFSQLQLRLQRQLRLIPIHPKPAESRRSRKPLGAQARVDPPSKHLAPVPGSGHPTRSLGYRSDSVRPRWSLARFHLVALSLLLSPLTTRNTQYPSWFSLIPHSIAQHSDTTLLEKTEETEKEESPTHRSPLARSFAAQLTTQTRPNPVKCDRGSIPKLTHSLIRSNDQSHLTTCRPNRSFTSPPSSSSSGAEFVLPRTQPGPSSTSSHNGLCYPDKRLAAHYPSAIPLRGFWARRYPLG